MTMKLYGFCGLSPPTVRAALALKGSRSSRFRDYFAAGKAACREYKAINPQRRGARALIDGGPPLFQ